MKASWVPREHGAWGMIGGAFFSVVAVHGRMSLAMGLFLLGFLFLYFTRVPFQQLFRGKAIVTQLRYIGLFGVPGWLLVEAAALQSGVQWFPAYVLILIPFFLVELLYIRWHRPNHFIPQLLGTIGLSAIAGLTDVLVHRTVTAHALFLWGVNALFFVAGITIVRQQIAARTRYATGRGYLHALRWGFIGYLLWGVIMGMMGASTASIAWWVLLPVMLEVAYFARDRVIITNLKTLGWIQIAQTVIFVALLAWLG